MFKSASFKAFPRKAKSRKALAAGIAVVLLLACAFWGFRKAETEPGEDLRRKFVAVLSDHFCSDQSARSDLLAIGRQKIPAFARLARIDVEGSWSLIYLGPFNSREEALAAVDFLDKQGLYKGNAEIETETEVRPNTFPGFKQKVVLELATLLDDELVVEELLYPRKLSIYAFARTTAISASNGEAWNQIYLGPFANEREAEEALEKLSAWELSQAFMVLPLL